MRPIRTIYIDTEPYCKSQIESLLKMIDINIKSSEILYDINWKFYISTEIDKINKKIEMNGIIGILIIDYDFYKEKNIRLVKKRKFIQLVGEYCTKENFLNSIKNINRTVSYNGRSKPDSKGHTGFDYEILNQNFGILLDDLPNVVSEDLVITCHNDRKYSKSGLYGGQKKVEQLLGLTRRKSDIYDNKESLTNLLYQIMFYQLTEQNERTLKLRHKLMKLHLEYNKDDIRGMLDIDEKLNNIIYTYDDSSIIEKDDIKCKLFEEIIDNSDDELKLCNICKTYYLQSDIECPMCKPKLDLLYSEYESKYKTYPIYSVSETGLGHWTDTGNHDESNATEIDIYEAIDIIKKIGTDIECIGFENGTEYCMIYDYTDEQGIPGLYIPFSVYELYTNLLNKT